MATITLKGNQVHTLGELPKIGSKAPGFQLIKKDLSPASLKDYLGSKIVLNVFPSVDTGTCAASVRKFNQLVASLENTKVLCISKDLPFALSRFCGAEGIENVEVMSDFATGQFGKDYKLQFTDGPLNHLLSRAIIVLDEEGTVIYTEQVAETTVEPNYDNAVNALKKLAV